ncbi:hypothetical protein [Rhizobium sp. SGZ-381]|uniref:hypothetical protein n=1 Tax=Rhizobium sp. SGZ-381 TaxID=3342800 RepID=UPI00366EA66A
MSSLAPDLADALTARFGDRFSQGEALRQQHGRGEHQVAGGTNDSPSFRHAVHSGAPSACMRNG